MEATAVPDPIRPSRYGDHLFYSITSVLMAAAIVAGFARSWFLSRWFDVPPGTPDIGALLMVHGLCFTAWVAILVIQPLLVLRGDVRTHRRVGAAAMVLAAVMVLLGNLAAIASIHVGYIGLGDPYAFYAIPFFDIQVFAICVAIAFWWRRSPEVHKRFMLLASTQILEAGLARTPIDLFQAGLPYSSLFGVDAVILAGIVYDVVRRGRPHPAWLWGGFAVLLSEIARLAVMNSAPWLAFAHFMGSLYTPA